MSNILTSIFLTINYFYRANLEWLNKFTFCSHKNLFILPHHNSCIKMEGEVYHPITMQQCKLLYFCFLFFLSTQRGYSYDPYNVVKDVFSWFAFENSLDKDLFCNVHRMDKISFYWLCCFRLPQQQFLVQFRC